MFHKVYSIFVLLLLQFFPNNKNRKQEEVWNAVIILKQLYIKREGVSHI